ALDGARGVSLSEGVARLAKRGRFKAVDVGDEPWIDVDTPEARRAAEAMLLRYGDDFSVRLPRRPLPSALLGAGEGAQNAERAARLEGGRAAVVWRGAP